MKIFKFDPATGGRGEQIGQTARASWAAGYWQGYTGQAPVGFGADAEVTVHQDAGVTDRAGKDVSYRHPTEWICFCLGCWQVSADEDHWEWIVLAPLSVDLSGEQR